MECSTRPRLIDISMEAKRAEMQSAFGFTLRSNDIATSPNLGIAQPQVSLLRMTYRHSQLMREKASVNALTYCREP